MDTTVSTGLHAVRTRRVELRKAMHALETALAAPAGGRSADWGVRIHAALSALAEEFAAHIVVTEGPEGIHQAILGGDLRLANAVTGLVREHVEISAGIGHLVTDTAPGVGTGQVEGLRDRATALLATIARHRQRGADLIYEAYETDIGGGD